jgi:DNA-nicking Smr family endonuclease
MGKKRHTELGGQQNDSAEASAFRAAVRDVKPLVQVPSAKGLAKPSPLIATSSSDQAARGADVAAGSAALSFHRAGVRVQVMRRLRRGLYPAEDELDLHGLTQTAARDSLADFIARSRDSGRRCVRIIHGKGYRSGARGPVLKTAVDLWLRRHTDVMAFTSARAIDGGTGAVYVLLRG